MKVIDYHCDTIALIMEKGNSCLKNNDFSVDVEKLIKGNYKAQFFAMFVYMENEEDPKEKCINMINRFYYEINENNDYISIAKNYGDMLNNSMKNKISAFLTIEEGGTLKGDINNLRYYYDLGVRLITLTWNFHNEIGFPGCKEEFEGCGLTSFGMDVVREMNRLGMIVDVAHLSDRGFYDVADISKKPFVASHSNAREVCKVSRNLSDDMIKILSEKGGTMGINFASCFLGENKISLINDMVRHIKHIRNVGGIDVISIGTDFDGIKGKLEISNAGEISKLEQALEKEGFTIGEIEKIFYKNAERVIKDVMI